VTGACIQQWAECIHYVPGSASLGRLADGGGADDAGAVTSADDYASSTSHPVATQWCCHAGHFMTAPPPAHNVFVSGCTQLQPLRRRKPDAAD